MRILTILTMLLLASQLIFNCAGTKKETTPEATAENDNQQKELDDIEALLGITPSEQPADQPSNNEEKLELLDTNELTPQSQATASTATQAAALQENELLKEKQKLEQENKRLKQQLQEKNRKIAELNALLDEQSARLAQVQSQPTPAPAASFTGDLSPVSGQEYKERYDQGRAAFENRQYQQAIQIFESLLSSSTTHPLADNAQYWIGEAHYMLKQYDAAIIDFEKVLTFPNSNKRADAQFKLGLCYIRKGQLNKAAEELNRFIEEYPNSPNVARAKALLAKF